MTLLRHVRCGASWFAIATQGVILAASLSGAALAQDATFTRSDYVTLGGNHVVADFNRDGKPDLAGLGPMSAAVLLGNGNGTFGARAEYPVATWAQDLAPGDFDGDGLLDLAVTINDPTIGLSLLKGNGDGTFAAPVSFANTSGFDSPAIVATDLDNDGRLDLVVGHQIACYTAPCTVAQTITVLRGNGDGTFQPAREIVVGSGTAKIAVGDFNRDGIRDLALAADSSRVHILIGAGDGTFAGQTTLTLTADTLGVDATDVDVGDFNGDGLQDLVVAIALNGSRTAILLGNGDGTFRAPLIITEPGLRIPHYQAVGDFNRDGFQDLAIALGWGSQGLMEILHGRGDGTFRPPVLYLVPPPQSSISGGAIVAGDFNSDGKPDLALGIVGASPAFAALTNSTGAAPPPIPAAPALLSPANDAIVAQPVALDWSDVTGATLYRIQIEDSSTFSSPFVADRLVTASQFTASSLVAGRRYWWRVRGINSAGTAGAWSTVRRFTAQGTTTSSPALSAISVSPSSVVGGNAAQGTVTSTVAAPAGGFAVALASNNGAATVPASVTIAQGATSATFSVATSTVSASTAVTLTATAAGVTRTTTLTVTPPASPAATFQLTVTATGRSGERITSSPAGISVAVGSSGSAPFASGATITLSVSNGRDAIWSGACSSGGDKRRTCSFTIRANAAVTANVQ